MTTQTDDSIDLLPSLDACPCCEEKRCDNAAEFWLKSHGCRGALVCETHRQENVDYLNDLIERSGILTCLQCYQQFTSVRDAITVIPL